MIQWCHPTCLILIVINGGNLSTTFPAYFLTCQQFFEINESHQTFKLMRTAFWVFYICVSVIYNMMVLFIYAWNAVILVSDNAAVSLCIPI